MASQLTAYHLRGMTDVGGSPTATIATIAVEHWDDGTIKYTDANGLRYEVSDVNALRLIGLMLTQDVLPPHQ